MAIKKNPRVKSAGTQCEFTPDNLIELDKCRKDPVYFVRKYVKIQHPTLGAIPFDLYDFQEHMLRAYKDNRYVIVLSSRQTGKSITSAAYLLWYAMFSDDKTVLIASNKNSNAMEMIFRMRYAYEELPLWLKPGVTDDGWNKHNITFDNGSRIISTATSEESGRGLSISLLFLDEFAFVKPGIQDEFWTSIQPTLSTGGSCIMTSTPNGDTNIYAQLWRGAELGVENMDEGNGFYPIRVKWDEPPGRGEAFKKDTIGKLGQRKWDQEFECIFLSSEALLIDSLTLAQLTPRLEKLEPIKVIKDVKFYKDIKPGGTYLMGIDPSTGSGLDFSVISVFEFPSMVQVAEWRKNTMSSNRVYGVIKSLIKYIETFSTTIYFSVENNGVGEGIIALFEADENPPELAELVSEDGKDKRGMTSTPKSKMRSCVNFKEMLENGSITINSLILLKELKNYVRYKGAYAAQTGATDDSISSVLIVMRLLEEIAQYEQAAFDKLYAGEYDEWDEKDYDGDDGWDENAEMDPMVM